MVEKVRKVRKIHYNYYVDKDGKHFEVAEVGKNGVKAILEHLPAGPGDVCFYDIEFDDTSIMRTFNPSQVFFSKEFTNIEVPKQGIVMPN